jgi:hypothetical protein
VCWAGAAQDDWVHKFQRVFALFCFRLRLGRHAVGGGHVMKQGRKKNCSDSNGKEEDRFQGAMLYIAEEIYAAR